MSQLSEQVTFVNVGLLASRHFYFGKIIGGVYVRKTESACIMLFTRGRSTDECCRERISRRQRRWKRLDVRGRMKKFVCYLVSVMICLTLVSWLACKPTKNDSNPTGNSISTESSNPQEEILSDENVDGNGWT